MPKHILTEIWRPVVGFEDLYSVSNLGQVKRVGRTRGATAGRIKQPTLDRKGYARVMLSRKHKPKLCGVHRLVAAAFVGPCPEGKAVNHKDGVKDHNAASNLEYMTAKENTQHAIHVTGRIVGGEGNSNARLSHHQVKRIRERYRRGAVTLAQLGQRFGVCASTIGYITRGNTWKEKGMEICLEPKSRKR